MLDIHPNSLLSKMLGIQNFQHNSLLPKILDIHHNSLLSKTLDIQNYQHNSLLPKKLDIQNFHPNSLLSKNLDIQNFQLLHHRPPRISCAWISLILELYKNQIVL